MPQVLLVPMKHQTKEDRDRRHSTRQARHHPRPLPPLHLRGPDVPGRDERPPGPRQERRAHGLGQPQHRRGRPRPARPPRRPARHGRTGGRHQGAHGAIGLEARRGGRGRLRHPRHGRAHRQGRGAARRVTDDPRPGRGVCGLVGRLGLAYPPRRGLRRRARPSATAARSTCSPTTKPAGPSWRMSRAGRNVYSEARAPAAGLRRGRPHRATGQPGGLPDAGRSSATPSSTSPTAVSGSSTSRSTMTTGRRSGPACRCRAGTRRGRDSGCDGAGWRPPHDEALPPDRPARLLPRAPPRPAQGACGIAEKDFQRQVLELAKLYRWHAYHPALSKWSERGWPDLALVRPPRLVFAELKSESGKVTEHQERWLGVAASLSRHRGVPLAAVRPRAGGGGAAVKRPRRLRLIATEPADRCDAAPPAAMNPVVLALVAALRDVERRRGRGTVPCPSDTRRTAA